MIPGAPIALDALAMAAVAVRDNLPPLGFGDPAERVEIETPIAKERGVYLASTGQYEPELYEKRFLNRKFPLAEAQMLGGKTMRSITVAGGPSKSFRIPTEQMHLRGDVMTFFALAAPGALRALLAYVPYLGKKRSVGLGRVDRWDVGAIEPWDGFPVLRDGRPLRPLPLDWPGLGAHRVENRVLSPPYWERWREEACAC